MMEKWTEAEVAYFKASALFEGHCATCDSCIDARDCPDKETLSKAMNAAYFAAGEKS
jgi:predicted metal-binding protein